jgi:diguanylate cyclase (GGDEF)-like protein
MENKLTRSAPKQPEGFAQWQRLLNEIAELVGLTLVAYDANEFFLGASQPNPICEAIQQKREGLRLCEADCGSMLSQSAKRGPLRIFKCHAHLFSFATPIYTEGKICFVLLGGRVFQSYQDFSRFSKEASKYSLRDYVFVDWENALKFQGGFYFERTARLIQSIVSSFSGDSPLLQKAKRRSVQLDTLYELSGLISLESTPEKAYQLVLEAIGVLFEFHESAIFRGETEGVNYQAASTMGPLLVPRTELSPAATDLIGILRQGQAHFIDETYHILKMGYPEGVRTIHSFPIISGGELTAILQIFNASPQDEVVQLLQNFCRHLAVSLENLRLKRELRDQVEVLSAVEAFISTSGGEADVRNLCHNILVKVAQVLRAEQGSILLLDESGCSLVVKAIKGINEKIVERLKVLPGEGIAGGVFESGRALLVKDIAKEIEPEGPRRSRYKTCSFLSVPLKSGQQKIGVLNLSDRSDGGPFDRHDLQRLETLTGHVSATLEKVEYHRRSEDLRKISITDPLTGLFNRRFFQERLTEEIARSKRHGHAFCLIMLDIDDFKNYNDSCGHLGGDEALKITAQLIHGSIRSIDIVARYGGEEFAVILPITDMIGARSIAERIRSSVAGHLFPDQSSQMAAKLTVSLGIASFPSDADNVQELIGNADKALYEAKVGGKNQAAVFDRNKRTSTAP